MNIFRWRRKSKKKIKLKTLVLVVFSLIMTTFAWFAYSKVLDTTLNLHLASWDMKYSIGGTPVVNPIGIDISTLYPTMEEQSVTVDIKNNGETMVDIEYQIQSVTIAGTSYEIVQEGATNTNPNYISVASGVLATNASGEQVYKSVITNDISKFPFIIEVEHSAQVAAAGQGYLTITVNWIGDNNKLDSEWGYRVGEFIEANPTLPAMSMVLSINSYQVDPEGSELTDTLPITAATAPYLPTGFTKVPGTNLDTGLVITDASGNEFVWIEVPKTATIYGADNLDITEFTDAEYLTIENALNAYTTSYDMGADSWTSYLAIGISESNYKTLKKQMLKSIYQNGGFYIGRYETGIENSYRAAASASDPTETPVIKANAYPYNWVTCAQAYTVATKVSNSTDYTSSLMFGVQWELVLKYLETKGVPVTDIKTDSTSWGNYKNNNYNLTKANTKYLATTEWQTVSSPYEKFVDEQALLATGANTSFSKQNIYDLAGNLAEWTFNVIIDSGETLGGFGGDYTVEGTNSAGHRGNYKSTSGLKNVGFRVSMFSNIHNGAVGDE